jgi:adenylyltransferase/sulfurtransferase
MDLNDARIERYSRQIILPQIGGRGQQRLLETTVSVVGDGPLAMTAAHYLTAAGVGRLELWAATASGVGALDAVRPDLMAFNPDPTIQVRLFDAETATVSPTAVFLSGDATTTVLASVNQAALSQRVPLVAGSVSGGAKLAVYAGHQPEWPCAQCDAEPPVYSEAMTSADARSGLIGSLMALEAIKLCLALPDAQIGSAVHFDAETLRISVRPIGKRADCRACAGR